MGSTPFNAFPFWVIFFVILRLNAHELLAFVYIFIECTLPRQSPIENRVLYVEQWVFTSMMRIRQPANRGLACRIPCCPVVWWQSGLFSASAMNVRVAHEYKHAIQPCNTHLYCIVVTSWHCVPHHKLAVKRFIGRKSAFWPFSYPIFVWSPCKGASLGPRVRKLVSKSRVPGLPEDENK